MKKLTLLVPISLKDHFKDACKIQYLECEFSEVKFDSLNLTAELTRRNQKEISLQTVFNLGRQFENLITF